MLLGTSPRKINREEEGKGGLFSRKNRAVQMSKHVKKVMYLGITHKIVTYAAILLRIVQAKKSKKMFSCGDECN